MVGCTCAVSGCLSSSYTHTDLRFHQFPRTQDRCDLWIKKCGRPDLFKKSLFQLRHVYACNLHFEPRMYGKKNLKKMAVPTLFLPVTKLQQIKTQKEEIVQLQQIKTEKEEIVQNYELIKTEHNTDVRLTGLPCSWQPLQANIKIEETVNTDDESQTANTDNASHTANTDDASHTANIDDASHTANIDDESETANIDDESETANIDDESETANTDDASQTASTDDASQTAATFLHSPRQRQLKPTSHGSHKRLKNTTKQYRRIKMMKMTKEDENVTEQQFIKGCETFLCPKLRAIVKMQMGLKRHCKNNKYSKAFKLFCLDIFFTSPLAYRFLSKAISLPSKVTLAGINLPTNTKLNNEMYDLLAATAKHMSPADKECVLCIDDMSLKCNLSYDSKADKILGLHEVDGEQRPLAASYAFTLMLRGIITNWQLPVGFSFIYDHKIDDQLTAWIVDAVKKLLTLGFNVRAFVSDHTSDYINFSKSLGVHKDNPSFSIDGKIMYYIFDVTRLIKSVRNNLMTCNFEFDGKTASWKDIENLYDIEKLKDTRLAPRLTDCHVSPNDFQKQKLRFAADVFSDSVAAALENYAVSNDLVVSGGTIEFIGIMNDIFELLNSSIDNFPKPFINPFDGNKIQNELLDRAQSIFSNIKITNMTTGRDVTNMMKFVNAFSITITSFRQLLNDMQSDNNRYLLTGWINNECLEHLFRITRQVGKNWAKPTCIQFKRAFRKSFLYQLLKLSDKTNHTEDFDSTLAQFGEFSRKYSFSQDSELNIPQPKSARARRAIQLPEKNSFQYICEYLFRRCVEKHKCNPTINSVEHDPNSLYARLRTFIAKDDQNSNKQVSPKAFVTYCRNLDRELKSSFQKFTGNNISQKLFRHLLKEVSFDKPCACFPVDNLVKIFIRMRLHCIIKINNKKFCKEFKHP